MPRNEVDEAMLKLLELLTDGMIGDDAILVRKSPSVVTAVAGGGEGGSEAGRHSKKTSRTKRAL